MICLINRNYFWIINDLIQHKLRQFIYIINQLIQKIQYFKNLQMGILKQQIKKMRLKFRKKKRFLKHLKFNNNQFLKY